jgi:sigma-B regulation protein RsbU (phosphoserine phosphatase)
MKILIAEDDPVSRCFLEVTLVKWGYEVIATSDGNEAWEAFQREMPTIAILDWMMPGIDGAEVCRRARAIETTTPAYLIMLTAKSEKEDVVKGLCAGADDYITKPFNRHELHARIKVGLRMAELQRNVAVRVVELERALSRVKQLQGLLPICSYCKKVRDDQNYWQQVDSYISKHSEVEFSHGICPECYDRLVEPQLQKLEAHNAEREA